MIGQCRFCGGWVATDHEFLGDKRICQCKSPNIEGKYYPNDVCRPVKNLFLSQDGLVKNRVTKDV